MPSERPTPVTTVNVVTTRYPRSAALSVAASAPRSSREIARASKGEIAAPSPSSSKTRYPNHCVSDRNAPNRSSPTHATTSFVTNNPVTSVTAE
jgi:hypothetical protein